ADRRCSRAARLVVARPRGRAMLRTGGPVRRLFLVRAEGVNRHRRAPDGGAHQVATDTPLHGRCAPLPCCGSLLTVTTLQDKVPAGLDRKEVEVYRRLDPARLPQHIAIIMDGNGRWAKRRHMPRVAGHRAGVTAVRSTVETAARIHIPALTLYA